MLHQVYCKIDRISTTYFGISNSSAIGLFLGLYIDRKGQKKQNDYNNIRNSCK